MMPIVEDGEVLAVSLHIVHKSCTAQGALNVSAEI